MCLYLTFQTLMVLLKDNTSYVMNIMSYLFISIIRTKDGGLFINVKASHLIIKQPFALSAVEVINF